MVQYTHLRLGLSNEIWFIQGATAIYALVYQNIPYHDYSNYIQDRYGRPNSRQHLLGLSKVGSTFCSVQVGPVDTFRSWKLSLYLRIRLKGRKLSYLKEWIPFSWVEILDLHIPGFTHILFKYLNS